MNDRVRASTAGSGSDHDWVRFHNPRNRKVNVVACVRCGIAKGPISSNVVCEELDQDSHRMQKMGWQAAPKLTVV